MLMTFITLQVELICDNLIINKQLCRKEKPGCRIFKHGLSTNRSSMTLNLSDSPRMMAHKGEATLEFTEDLPEQNLTGLLHSLVR